MQIIYITDKNIINYIPVSMAKITYTNKGISMQFELPEETKLIQIIIDTDQFSKYTPALSTSQIEAFDKNRIAVWNNCTPLYYNKRYIDLYLVKNHIIYPVMSQKLPSGITNETEHSNEIVLNKVLNVNTWN